MLKFGSAAPLLGRYPEIALNRDFQAWFKKYGGEIWHEAPASKDGYIMVYVQSHDRLRLFAALLKRTMSYEESDWTVEFVTGREVNLASEGISTEPAALALLKSQGELDSGQIQAVRPVFDLSRDDSSVGWEVELTHQENLGKYLVHPDLGVEMLQVVSLESFKAARLADRATIPPEHMGDVTPVQPMALSADWLAANGLHHPDSMRAEALSWINGATTVLQKAQRIFLNVRSRFFYDATISGIREFTHSDDLVLGRLGRRGVCDEFAVVQISYLRALGIPAALKLMTMTINGFQAAHACLEFLDSSTWRHMDALFNAFDLRSIYRIRGWDNVKVLDANFPQDSLSSEPAWGLPEPVGDGLFHPFRDFVLNPDFTGERRPGYSY